MSFDKTMSEIRANNKAFKDVQEGRVTIPVQDCNTPEYIVERFNLNRVTVHIGHTRSQLEEMTREEANKRNYDIYMGQSGFDDGLNGEDK